MAIHNQSKWDHHTTQSQKMWIVRGNKRKKQNKQQQDHPTHTSNPSYLKLQTLIIVIII